MNGQSLFQAATNIKEIERGFWVSRTISDISYPKEANQACFEVEESSFWFAHRNGCIRELLKTFPTNGPLIDVGGGNGIVSKMIQDANISVILLEPGDQGCLHARTRGIRTVIRSTLQDAGFKGDTLPAVGLFDVIEHVEDDHSFLKSVVEMLVPGGNVYLSVPAGGLLWSKEDDYAGHFRRYTKLGLSNLCVKCGLKILYVGHIFALLPLPIFLFRSLPSRFALIKKFGRNTSIGSAHHPLGRLGNAMLQVVLSFEIKSIAQKRSIPMGSSIIAVAQKT
jgi:SAM-dependent methyltransferase